MLSDLARCSGSEQSESGTLASTAEILAGLCERVAALEALPERVAALERRVVKKRPDTSTRRMTRPDRCPFGWKPHLRAPAVLTEDPFEQQMIFRLIEFAQDPKASFRELCRRLDLSGCRRRDGKKWVGAHGLVRSILRREGILTSADATAAMWRRTEAVRARAADRYTPEIITSTEARVRARGER